MNKKIFLTIIIISLLLAGCEKTGPTQNGQAPLMATATNSAIAKSLVTTTPTGTISTSDTIDYNQYIKKTWIKSKNNQSQENGVSFIISSIENRKMTGELTVVGQGPSCPNTVADLSGTINKDAAECQFTDSRGNKGNIKLVFKQGDSIEATIKLMEKSTDDIAQPPEGTFLFSPWNIKDEKEFSPIESQSFMVNLNSWGNVKFVSGKFKSADYVLVEFYLTNKDGDILYDFDPTFTNNVDVKAVSFKDVNSDGLKDIIIIVSDNNNSDQDTAIYLQKPDGSFSDNLDLDQEVNDSGNNKDIQTVTEYLSQFLSEQSSDNLSLLLENKAKNIIKNPKLPLISWYKLIGVATGDLNADNRSDLTVVVEYMPGDFKGTRTLYVLFQNSDGTYNVVQKNKNVINGKLEGGPFGDPYQNIEIKNGVLNVNEYGGSRGRWEYSNQFKYSGSDFILVKAQKIGFDDIEGYAQQTDYDFSDKSVKCTAYNMFKSNKPKLVFSYKQSNTYVFNTFDIDDFENSIDGDLQYLPDLETFEIGKSKPMLNLKISTNKALDLVKDYLKINMNKVNISWTPETKANYSSLLTYTVPDYYYQKDNKNLYYFKYEKNVHTIILSDDKDEFTFYDVDDITGKVKAE